ncbi:MAG: helix-turn-helix domain-containing protein [Desulfobulbales bacterium]|nr:helix-turn-helix domain-containing protein [Desulfobulbales bacterium]
MNLLIATNIKVSNIIKIFSDADYTVYNCHFESIIEATERFSPDLILLYCGCRVKSCLQTLKGVKSGFPSIPVIFLTRISAEHIAIEAFRLGAKDYFREPLDFNELKTTINNLAKYISQTSEKRQAAVSPASVITHNSFASLPGSISNVVLYMEKNLAKDLNLEKLAKKAAMSKHHFCRVFKKHTGTTPIHFLTCKRIEKAKLLLLDESLTIANVISAVGFHDQSNFIKNFKKIEGVTPSLYRRDNLSIPDRTT